VDEQEPEVLWVSYGVSDCHAKVVRFNQSLLEQLPVEYRLSEMSSADPRLELPEQLDHHFDALARDTLFVSRL